MNETPNVRASPSMSEPEFKDHEARRIAERAELKADTVGSRLDRIDTDIREGFKKASDATSRVHGRIDKLLWGVGATLALILLQIVLSKLGLL